MDEIESLSATLREKAQGRIKWYAMGRDETGYFIDFDSKRDAERWMADQNAKWVEREGVHLVSKHFFTELEVLANRAADELDAPAERVAELEQELRNIANADTVAWDDPSQFEAWAKNRATHALGGGK